MGCMGNLHHFLCDTEVSGGMARNSPKRGTNSQILPSESIIQEVWCLQLLELHQACICLCYHHPQWIYFIHWVPGSYFWDSVLFSGLFHRQIASYFSIFSTWLGRSIPCASVSLLFQSILCWVQAKWSNHTHRQPELSHSQFQRIWAILRTWYAFIHNNPMERSLQINFKNEWFSHIFYLIPLAWV